MIEKEWYVMKNVQCYRIQDIMKCSTVSQPRKSSSKMKIEKSSQEEGKSGVLGGEGKLMRIQQ